MRNRILAAFAALAAGLIVAACGGGGGGAGATGPTTVSGAAVKGPVAGGLVTVQNASNGAILGTTTTSLAGTYSLQITFSGDVVVTISGGTYTDEITGDPTPLNQLKTVLSVSSGSVTATLSPLTYLAYVIGGPNSTSFNTVAANLATQFGLGSTNIVTSVPLVSGTLNDYGRVLRAVSQYVRDRQLGGSPTFSVNELIALQMGNTATFASLQPNFTTAFLTANGGTITFAFDGSTLTVGGAGGGGGSCAVTVDGSGTVTTGSPPMTVPFTLPPTKVCVTGLGAASCNAGNSTLNSIAAAGAVSGTGYSLTYNYSYSSDCTGALYTVAYVP